MGGTKIGKGGLVLAAKIGPGGPVLAADRFFRYRPTLPTPLPPAAHPLICGIRDISGSVQNKSQNQRVHLVAM